MTADEWIAYLDAGNPVRNIGQLDKATIAKLNVLVRRGYATRELEYGVFPRPIQTYRLIAR